MCDFAIWRCNHVRRQHTARDTRCFTERTARTRNLLDNIGTIAEVHVTCFRPSLLSKLPVSPVGRNERDVITQPEIERQMGGGSPGILAKRAEYAAWTLHLI